MPIPYTDVFRKRKYWSFPIAQALWA